MSFYLGVPLIVAIIGAVLYCVFNKPETANYKELAKAMWWCGLLVTLFAVAGYDPVHNTFRDRPVAPSVR